MQLLLAIHDVAPPFMDEVCALWDLCRRHGCDPALLVVPDWHGTAPLTAAPALVHWVRARQAEGSDILLHGVRHDEAGLARGVGDWLRAVGRTDREGEFLTLDASRAQYRIATGQAMLGAVGLHPMGFVPPAWLRRPGLRRAVRRAGLAVTEDTSAIWLVEQGRRVASPVIRWSARSRWRARCSTVVAQWRTARATAPVLRVALHPGDWRSPRVAASVRETVAALAERAQPITYAALVRKLEPGGAW